MITTNQAIKPLASLSMLSAITSRYLALFTKPLGWNRPKGLNEPDQNQVKPGNLTNNEPIGLNPYKGLIQSSPG